MLSGKDVNDLINLRSIALPLWSALTGFLNLHNILYPKQFGFRNNHSTALALIDLISNISSAIDRINLAWHTHPKFHCYMLEYLKVYLQELLLIC